MPEIVKVCKKHGQLAIENIKIHKDGFRCAICRREIGIKRFHKNRNSKSYRLNYKEILKRSREYSISTEGKKNKKLRRINLTNGYVRGMLKQNTSLKAKDIPQQLVEFKRTAILLKRKLREIKSENK